MFDYTAWTPSVASTALCAFHNQHYVSENENKLLETLLHSKGRRIYFIACVSSGHALTSARKGRVIDGRSVESVRIDCSSLFSDKTTIGHKKRHYCAADEVPESKGKISDEHIVKTRKTRSKGGKGAANRTQNIHFVGEEGCSVEIDENITGTSSPHANAKVSEIMSSTASSTATTPTWITTTDTRHIDLVQPPICSTTNIQEGVVRTRTSTDRFIFPPTTSSTSSDAVVGSEGQKSFNHHRQYHQQLRLKIKVYSKESCDKSSYCGYIGIPLDSPPRMLPKGLPLGPNW